MKYKIDVVRRARLGTGEQTGGRFRTSRRPAALAALCYLLLEGCATTPADDSGGDAACNPTLCINDCTARGYGSGSCVEGACLCGDPDADADAGADDADVPDGPACSAIDCNARCVLAGAERGECHGGECVCTPPVGADADADVPAEAEAGADADADVADDDSAAPDDTWIGECVAGSVDISACIPCGTRTRVCGPDGRWGEWGTCSESGDCTPGDVETGSCGPYDCGSHTRTCDPTCAWGAWDACDSPPEVCNRADDDCDNSIDEGDCSSSMEFPAPPVRGGSTIFVTTRYPEGVVCVELRVTGPTGVFYGDFIDVSEGGPPRWGWLWEVRLPATAGTYHFEFRHQGLCGSPCSCSVLTSPVTGDLVVE